MTPTRTRPPVPLTAARVLVGLQIVVGLLGVVAGGLAAAGSAGDGSAAGPWSGLLAVLAVGVAVAGLVTGLLLGVPLLVLRGGSPTRRVTGRGLLVGGEALLLLPVLVFAHARFGTVIALGTDPASLGYDTLVLVPLVVIGLLLAPSVGRWTLAP